MTTTLGIGVIGMGWMGTAHSRSYRLVNDRFHDAGVRARLVEPRRVESEAAARRLESLRMRSKLGLQAPTHVFDEGRCMHGASQPAGRRDRAAVGHVSYETHAVVQVPDPDGCKASRLIEAGADVNAVDAYGRTALAQIEALEDTAIVALLREAASNR